MEAPRAEAPGTLTVARTALEQAARVADAAFALLLAELRLARSSAIALLGLSFALVFFGVGAWLGTNAAIAALVYELTGNVFYGVGSVALLNLVGIAVVLFAMRKCARDITMPRTRRLFSRIAGKRT